MKLGWHGAGVLGGVPLDCCVSGENLLSWNLRLARNCANTTILWLCNGDLCSFVFSNHGGLVSLLTGASVRTNNREWLTGLNFAKDNTILL